MKEAIILKCLWNLKDYNNVKEIQIESQYQTVLILSLKFEIQDGTLKPKGWLAIAKLKPLSLFISLLSMPKKAFDNVKIEK